MVVYGFTLTLPDKSFAQAERRLASDTNCWAMILPDDTSHTADTTAAKHKH